MLHSARIRLPRSWSDKEINEYIDELLHALNVSHVQHSVIGDDVNRGISGGQRKRVNIGVELAAVPVGIFLDEPTSGLDSTSALEVTKILQGITALGLTIVAVIHQPRVEIFELFHDVLMIAPVFHGIALIRREGERRTWDPLIRHRSTFPISATFFRLNPTPRTS